MPMDTSNTKEQEIQKSIAGHGARNASLRQLLLDKNVDISRPRTIDFHFWAASPTDAEALANDLRARGLTIVAQRRAAIDDASLPWNVEAQAAQSVELTVRNDFTEELVRLANTHNSRYDGWGTQI